MSRPRGRGARSRLGVAVTVVALAWGRPPRIAAQAFPTTPPTPTRLSPVGFPPFQTVTLPNSLELVVIEHHAQPVLSVSLTWRAGAAADPAGKEGLAGLVAELLTKGTDTHSAEQIAQLIEGVGGSLSASAGDDFLTVSADALSDQLELVCTLLGDVALHATFPEGELELARTRALSALALELSEPGRVAQRRFASELYGRHPYGRSATRESYRAITKDDVVQFARQRLRPAGALLVVAGDVTAADVRELATRALGAWRGSPPGSALPPVPATRVRTDIVLVHRPGSAQANIALGNTTTGPSDPSYYPARVAVQALGGGADSRLFLILREQKGWTYGAYAALHRYRGRGYWQATAEVRTEVADSALGELLHQVDRVRSEPIPAAELSAVKGFLVGSFPLTIETPNQIAAQIANAQLLGLGEDYLRRYRERLNAVTALEARAAAARLFRRQGLTIVVVGDATRLYKRLEAIAPVRLVDLDGKPLTPAELSAPATTVTLDSAQLAPRTDSSQVLLQGKAVGFAVATVQHAGDSVVYVERSNLGSGTFEQRTTVVFAAADGAARRLDQRMTRQGATVEAHLTYGGGRVHGTSFAPQPDGSVRQLTIDTTIAPGSVDENVAPFVAAALALTPGQTVRLAVFTPSEVASKVLTFKVGAKESVTVPAGTFEAYHVDVSGARFPFVLYVSAATPHRVVKQEFVGQPFVIELVK